MASELIKQMWPPAPKWTADNVPDLSGKVVFITGGNVGIGKETARVCLAHNAKVYIGCRDAERALKAIENLKEQTGKMAHYLKLDLADFKSIQAAVAEFTSHETQLNILFNNAGIMDPPLDMFTVQGYDMTFGTNTLGHFYLTKLLLPTLTATAASSPDKHVRVIHTSSSGIYINFKGLINYDTLKGESPERKKLGTQGMYNQSKSGNILFSNELARRYGDQGIVSISLNPGNIHTELGRNFSTIKLFLVKPLVYDISYGPLTQLYAGTAPEAAKLNGKFLIPWARVGEPRADHNDPKIAGRFWDWMEEQVKDA